MTTSGTCDKDDLRILEQLAMNVMTESSDTIFFEMIFTLHYFAVKIYNLVHPTGYLTDAQKHSHGMLCQTLSSRLEKAHAQQVAPALFRSVKENFNLMCNKYAQAFKSNRPVYSLSDPDLPQPGYFSVHSPSGTRLWDEILPLAIKDDMTKQEKLQLLKDINFLRDLGHPMFLDLLNMHRKIENIVSIPAEAERNLIDMLVSVQQANQYWLMTGLRYSGSDDECILRPLDMKILRSNSYSFGIDIFDLPRTAYYKYSVDEVREMVGQYFSVDQPVPYLFRDMIECAYLVAQRSADENRSRNLLWDPKWVYMRYTFSDTSPIMNAQLQSVMISACGKNKIQYDNFLALCTRVADDLGASNVPGYIISSGAAASGEDFTLSTVALDPPVPRVQFREPIAQITEIPSRRAMREAELHEQQQQQQQQEQPDLDAMDVDEPNEGNDDDYGDDDAPNIPTDTDYSLSPLRAIETAYDEPTKATMPISSESSVIAETVLGEFEIRASAFEHLCEEDLKNIHSDIVKLQGEIMFGTLQSKLESVSAADFNQPVLLDSAQTLFERAGEVSCHGRDRVADPEIMFKEKLARLNILFRKTIVVGWLRSVYKALKHHEPMRLNVILEDTAAAKLGKCDIDDILTASIHALDLPEGIVLPTLLHALNFRLDKIVLAIRVLFYKLIRECLCSSGVFEISEEIKNALTEGGGAALAFCDDPNIGIWFCAMDGDMFLLLQNVCDSFLDTVRALQTAVDVVYRKFGI